MLKFFRQIRQRLLAENRFSKYLLYAVGEILLIVIGVIIALQLNNWNLQEGRNKQKQKLLQSILIELSHDSTYLGDRVIHAKNSLTRFQLRNQMIYRGIERADLDTLLSGPLYWSSHFETPRNSYRQLAETGLIWELTEAVDTAGLNIYWMVSTPSNLGELIVLYYEMYDIYNSSVKSNTELLDWMVNEDNHIGFKRLHRDFRRTHSEKILEDHTWIFNQASDNYKKMMDMSEGRVYYCVMWIRYAQNMMKFIDILEREITNSLLKYDDE